MRGLVIFLLVAGALFWVGKDFLKKKLDGLTMETLASGSPEAAAQDRVKKILEGLKKDADGDSLAFQTAICQWDSELDAIQDQGEFEQAYDHFSEWRDEFDINHRKISGYEITKVELVQESPPVAMVSGTIEGRQFKMRVPHKRRISWVQEG
jgi:hypothetical protein